MVLQNQLYQEAYNSHLEKLGKEPIKFDSKTTVEDIKKSGATFENLIDCIGNIQVRMPPPPKLQIEPVNSVEFPEPTLNQTVGINKMVYEEEHDYLKDLQT